MKRAINFTIYFLIASSIILKAPSIMDNMQAEGKQLEPNKIYKYEVGGKETPLVFPATGRKKIVIFWASWCLPCKIELNRINEAIEKKEIEAENVLAISTDNNFSDLDKALSERKYLFQTYIDKDDNFLTKLKITGTPTMVLIDESNVIKWKTTGVSFDLIGKLKSFLKKE
jgi:thiol-disulfide isomerase/thioredoxin